MQASIRFKDERWKMEPTPQAGEYTVQLENAWIHLDAYDQVGLELRELDNGEVAVIFHNGEHEECVFSHLPEEP
jgi:hypothetical protein